MGSGEEWEIANLASNHGEQIPQNESVSRECDRAVGVGDVLFNSRIEEAYDVVANMGKVSHVFIILWMNLERISDRYAVIEAKKCNN